MVRSGEEGFPLVGNLVGESVLMMRTGLESIEFMMASPLAAARQSWVVENQAGCGH